MPSFLATSHSNQLPSKGTGNVTAETQILGADGNLLILPLEGSNILQTPGNCRLFDVIIAGYAGSGTTSTLELKMYLGTSTTIANNGTAIFDITTASLASTNQNFFIKVEFIYDSVSKKIQGCYHGLQVNTVIALAAVTATSLGSFSDLAEGQGFTLTALFGSTNASNNAVITTF
jgi:hypothetical protein